MTINELEEKIPYMLSLAYAQGKAIVLYEDRSCQHIKMSERLARHLENKLEQDILLRTKARTTPEPKERKVPAKPPRISKPFNKQLVIDMYNNNCEYREIAQAIGFALGTVSGIIRELLWNGDIKKRVKLQKCDQFILDNINTMQQTEIAKTLGVKVRYIYDRKVKLKKMGLLK